MEVVEIVEAAAVPSRVALCRAGYRDFCLAWVSFGEQTGCSHFLVVGEYSNRSPLWGKILGTNISSISRFLEFHM